MTTLALADGWIEMQARLIGASAHWTPAESRREKQALQALQKQIEQAARSLRWCKLLLDAAQSKLISPEFERERVLGQERTGA
jgi:hypothetical protein